MNELIPTFDWQRVVVLPWMEQLSMYGWIVLMGFLVATACGLVGNYLILRRMALVGDAISHSVLPGLAGAFLLASWFGISGSHDGPSAGHQDLRSPVVMFIGALCAGVVTSLLIELIHKKSRLKQDAAIGITFSSLFALGVILISLFSAQIDLDQECVLYGEITFVSLEPPVVIRNLTLGPPSIVRMALVAVLTALLIVLFYKELLVSSFDSGLAASLGINATVVHYALMCWLSIVVVSAFEAVGAILVIAMLIFPGATSSLFSNRLRPILILSVVFAAVSAVLGMHLSIWLDCSPAGAMSVMAFAIFLLSWLCRFLLSLTLRKRKRLSSQQSPDMQPVEV